jgi:alkylated DNA repair protein alkB family protein 6
MPHKDGPAYHPVVCTVSLGSSLTLEIFATKDDGTREANTRYQILQEPRSLLITAGKLYTDYLHGISEVHGYTNLDQSTVANWALLRHPGAIHDGKLQRSTRTSLTYRDVIKVWNFR